VLSAFDVDNGAKLWSINRPVDALIIRQNAMLSSFQNTLLVGASGGRLQALDPENGHVRWDAALSVQLQGKNDIERLADPIGRPLRVGGSVCVRAYQQSVSCIDGRNGSIAWSKPAKGFTELGGDSDMVVGTESDGRIKAWNRSNGTPLWSLDKLAHRNLSAPLVVGRSILVGDIEGYVHVLSKTDGSTLARIETDGSPIQHMPFLVGKTVYIQTKKGGLFAYSPK
jgi:outer membrane protein assembly factor BamB